MATDCTAASPQALHSTHEKTLDRPKESQPARVIHTAKQYVIIHVSQSYGEPAESQTILH
jgi:hypothetical protein